MPKVWGSGAAARATNCRHPWVRHAKQQRRLDVRVPNANTVFFFWWKFLGETVVNTRVNYDFFNVAHSGERLTTENAGLDRNRNM